MKPKNDQWSAVCALDDVPVLGARVLKRTVGDDIAVFRNAVGGVFALLDRCPHKGGPLSQGIVYGDRVACPLHNWQISLADGCAQAPDIGCADRFTVCIEDGWIMLRASEVRGAQPSCTPSV